MSEIYEIEETFRKLISDKLGIEFFQRRPPRNSIFLINIEAFPENIVTDNEIISCLRECFNTMGFELDLNSIKPKDDEFTWIEIRKGEEKLSVGITNAIIPFPYIIITVAK